MPAQYTTKQGDAVDAICYQHYGDQGSTVGLVYDANPGLAARGVVLPYGISITLPDAPVASPAKPVKLWS